MWLRPMGSLSSLNETLYYKEIAGKPEKIVELKKLLITWDKKSGWVTNPPRRFGSMIFGAGQGIGHGFF